jgi:DNA G:T-mismatch repair endonuclease
MRSPETRAKIRAAFASPEVRAKMRRVFSTETRAKIRAALLKPETNAKIRINRAQQLCPLKDTKPELAVQELLRDCGINFAKHKCIPGLNHQWDIKIEDRKILIEVDGCYWHGCPVCLLPKARTKQSDIPCTAFATAAGWAVIRIWECEIRAGDFSKLRSLCISVENWKAQSNGR